MMFKQIPRRNTLYHDKGQTTTVHINHLTSHFKKALLIVDDSSTMDYELPSIQKTSIYKVITNDLLEEKMIMSFRKYIILIKQGYIKNESYDIIIFRLNGMSRELMDCFKINYHLGFCETLIVCYFSTIEKLDYIYMSCSFDKSFYNVHNIFVEPTNDSDAIIYTNLKNKLYESNSCSKKIKNKIEELESITYFYALFYIRQNFKIEESDNDTEVNQRLSINDFKFKNTIKIINENSDYNIYLKCDNKNLVRYLNLQLDNDPIIKEYNTEIEDFDKSILIIYDPFEKFCYDINFGKIYIYHEANSDFNLYSLFENLDLDESNSTYLLQKYQKEEILYTLFSNTGAFYDYTSSYTILQHFFYILHKIFSDEHLYLKSSNLWCDYEKSSSQFLCKITFPNLHENFESISGTYKASKNEARKCAAYRALNFLRQRGFMDDHLCPNRLIFIDKNKIYYKILCETFQLTIKEHKSNNESIFSIHKWNGRKKLGITVEMHIENKGLDNAFIKTEIEKIRLKYLEENCTDNDITLERVKGLFERDHRVDVGFEKLPEHTDYIFEVKQPDALAKFRKTYFLYQCKLVDTFGNIIDCQLGLCTGKSFTEKLKFQDSEIIFLGTHVFNDDDLNCLLFFQVVLFLLNFKRIKTVNTASKEYCYFFIPIKNGKFDIETLRKFTISNFLISNVINLREKQLLKENLLYNPYNKKFYVYEKPCTYKITDTSSFNDEISYLDYYENKYVVKLKYKEGDDLVFFGFLFDCALSSAQGILSSEILYVTNLKIAYCRDFHHAKKFLYAFEKMALAFELKKNMNIKISTQNLIKCLSPKDLNYDNYERLEFLGDSVLKFVCSRFLFNFTLGDCVTKKDSLISNESLFKIAKKNGIIEYFSFIKYSDVLFQPPNLMQFLNSEFPCDDFQKCIDYFNVKNIFLSKNVTFQELKVKQIDDEIKGLKTYADIIEAMIGAYFIELGLKESEAFIEQLGITKLNSMCPIIESTKDEGNSQDKKQNNTVKENNNHNLLSSILSSENQSHNFKIKNEAKEKKDIFDCKFFNLDASNTSIVKKMKNYEGILKKHEINNIESILKYKFKYPGLIEKAMIHPSSNNNILGSINFNKLELLGDCVLDLVVTEKIYFEHEDFDPESMHCKRKSLVNNFSLARVLFKMKIDKYLHICFDAKHKETVIKKLKKDGETVNKAFGDVLESICGAIYIDMGCNYSLFKNYVISHLFHYLEACSDTTR